MEMHGSDDGKTPEKALASILQRLDEGRNWIRGQFMDSHRRMCLVAAIDSEGMSVPLRLEVFRRLERVTGCFLSIWNDQQENFGTVKAALLAAMEDGK